MYEQLALFPDSEIIQPEQPATPAAFRVLPLSVLAETPEVAADMLPVDEDAA
ncbi:hypothetical protein [Streptomyces sp. NPDC056387]|uniref:hypothetical protein n=1 Tax=Streptomyces sp. NPDC056387 TaxID=3345803 RepID=UPI0035D8903A